MNNKYDTAFKLIKMMAIKEKAISLIEDIIKNEDLSPTDKFLEIENIMDRANYFLSEN